MNQVFGTMTLAVSIDIPESISEDALDSATKIVNCYTLNLCELELQDIHKKIHKLRVQDVNVKWEKAYTDYGDDQ